MGSNGPRYGYVRRTEPKVFDQNNEESKNKCAHDSRPVAPENGTISFSHGNLHTSVATISCDPDYILAGDESVQCDATNNGAAWPTPNTKCNPDTSCRESYCCGYDLLEPLHSWLDNTYTDHSDGLSPEWIREQELPQ